MENLKIKDGQYLLLYSDEIYSAERDEHGEIEGDYSTSHDLENIKEIVVRAVCYYMSENGQLIRSLPELLKTVLEGVEEASDGMKETESLIDSEFLIRDVFKKVCNNF